MKKRVIAALLLLILNVFFVTTALDLRKNEKFTQIQMIHSPQPQGEISELVLSGDNEITFSFQSLMHTVDNLILKFSGCLELEEGWLNVTIHNNGITHYIYEVPVQAFETDDFYLHTGAIGGLEIDGSYDITISVRDLAQQELTLSLADSGHLKPLNGSASPFWGYEGKLGVHTPLLAIYLLLWAAVDAAGAAVLLFFDRLFPEDRQQKFSRFIQDLHKKWKSAHRGLYVCLTLLLLMGVASGIATVQYDNPEDSRTVSYWTRNNASRFTDVPLQNGPVVQPFAAKGGQLTEFILFLENYAPTDDATVWVKLEDKKGNEYFSWTAPISALGGESFCLIAQVERKVGRGEDLYLRMYLEGGPSAITVRSLDDGDYSGKPHKSVGDLTINGEVQEGINVHFYQNYQVSLAYSAVWYGALALTLVILLLMVWNPGPVAQRILDILCDVFLILTGHLTLELLSGNIYTIGVFYVLLNCAIIAGLYWVIKAITGRAAYYIAALLTFAAGITNYYVRLFKGTDFLLTEISAFRTAMSVTGTYEFTITPVVFTVVVVYVCLILMRVSVDLNRKPVSGKQRIQERAMALAGTLATVLLLSYGIENTSFDYFTLYANFEKYGWWYSNVMVLKNSSMKKPANYSDKEIERILSEVEPPEDETIIPQNIIVIMNEALSDLSIIGQLDTNQDYLPFIRSLSENTVKGNLHVHTYGGGTAISEYEFLTGNSFHFMPMGSMPYSDPNSDQGEPGMASTLKDQGYHTVAMHPYGPENWNRDQVYEAMGFDEFISIDAFEGYERIRDYVSDQGNYQKIIEYYESFQGENLFVFNVTMQNHGGYGITNGRLDTTISIGNADSEEAEIFLSLIQKSDEAFEYLLSYFSQVEEPTMIVMFGDHLPALSDKFYTALYGKESADRTALENSLKFVTPYIIWTNYESDFDEVPETSTNYLGRLVLQYAGVELSQYDQFILQQQKEIPVIGKYGIIDGDGNYRVYRDVADSQLTDYQILQYLRVEDGASKYRDIFRVNP